MKRTCIIAFLMVAVTLFGAHQASASWYFDIQETDTNVFDFLLVTDEALTFDGGTGSFLYDNPETLGWTYTFSYPSPQMELFGPPSEPLPGEIDNLTGASFGTPATLTDDWTLATFTFTGVGDANFRFDMDNSHMKFNVNGIIYSAVDNPEVFHNGTATVPVPAAIWLLGSGLAGLLGFRRKMNR